MASPSAGFNGMYFMRADWQEIRLRNNQTTTEMVWAPSATHGMNGATYAGILYGGYCTVAGLSMDFYSDDEPVRDDPTLEDNNVAAIVNATVAIVLDALTKVPQGGAGGDGTADIMLPLGCVSFVASLLHIFLLCPLPLAPSPPTHTFPYHQLRL